VLTLNYLQATDKLSRHLIGIAKYFAKNLMVRLSLKIWRAKIKIKYLESIK